MNTDTRSDIVNPEDSNPTAFRRHNHLAGEKSPYLLQHQMNPVDWHPWGETAFAKARAGRKPIFLSIGYATCHWCHVMERESFENPEVAAFLNHHFVSIKVDREERPDVDHIYMTALQLLTGQGGWPLNLFLTPDLQPFFGGTYFPPESRAHMPGFLFLLHQIADLWDDREEEVLAFARKLKERLAEASDVAARAGGDLSPDLLHRGAQAFLSEYDPVHGGFGTAPKFPRPTVPGFLLQYSHRFRQPDVARKVLHTCDAMAAGGIHDHLGGGFARYAVDEGWVVPHFEKMLYDNAQLAHLYLEAHLTGGHPRYARIARGIIEYVRRDMTSPEGGFYSAQDADSEGKEGKYYCWTQAELKTLLSPDEFEAVSQHFSLTEEGNFVDHSDPEPLPNQNVLCAASADLPADDNHTFAAAMARMLAVRQGRIPPLLDDKILASWNGMMLGAMARAAAVLGEDAWLEAARRNAAFLRARLWDENSATLYHRWREGQRDTVQLQAAYAHLLAGMIELYQATLEPEHLEFAVSLANAMIRRFEDPVHGGFFQSAADTPDLLARMKEDYDGAEPSGNAVAAHALITLAAITGKTAFRQSAERTLRLLSDRMARLPQALPALLRALDAWLHEPQRIVIAGDPTAPVTRKLLRAAASVYLPHRIILGTAGPVDAHARSLPRGDTPMAYPCLGNACQPPTSSADTLRQILMEADER